MIQELKLYNRSPDTTEVNQTPFSGKSDISFDIYGNFVKCTGEEGLEQNSLKALLTDTQLDGYGTDARKLLGKKNLEYVRGKLLYQILSTLDTLKTAQLQFLSKHPTYDKRNIVADVLNVKVDKKTNTSIICSLKVQSLQKKLVNSQNLDEINTVIQ